MSSTEIDAYLDTAPEPQRSTLTALRGTLLTLLPTAEEGLAYGVPAFRVDGVPVAGFAFSKAHCSYFPMSGSVLATLADEVSAYQTSKGALKFPVDAPLPKALVTRLVAARTAEIAQTPPRKRA